MCCGRMFIVVFVFVRAFALLCSRFREFDGSKAERQREEKETEPSLLVGDRLPSNIQASNQSSNSQHET